MEAREFVEKLKWYYMRNDGTVVLYSIPLTGPSDNEQPVPGLLMVNDKAGQRMFFDTSRWEARPGVQTGSDPDLPGIAFVMADQSYAWSVEAYPYYRQQIACANCAHEVPEKVTFHSDGWIRADG